MHEGVCRRHCTCPENVHIVSTASPGTNALEVKARVDTKAGPVFACVEIPFASPCHIRTTLGLE
jgi:hypothetical protein